MATTSSNLTAGTTIMAQGGKSKGTTGRAAGLVATAALGLALLGGLAFTQAYHAAPSAGAPPSGNHSGALAAPGQDWALADGTRPGLLALMPGETTARADQFTYREDRRAGSVLPAAVLATLDFGPVECGAAPCVSAPASGFVADPFTYREDHRALAGGLDWEQVERAQVA